MELFNYFVRLFKLIATDISRTVPLDANRRHPRWRFLHMCEMIAEAMPIFGPEFRRIADEYYQLHITRKLFSIMLCFQIFEINLEISVVFPVCTKHPEILPGIDSISPNMHHSLLKMSIQNFVTKYHKCDIARRPFTAVQDLDISASGFLKSVDFVVGTYHIQILQAFDPISESMAQALPEIPYIRTNIPNIGLVVNNIIDEYYLSDIARSLFSNMRLLDTFASDIVTPIVFPIGTKHPQLLQDLDPISENMARALPEMPYNGANIPKIGQVFQNIGDEYYQSDIAKNPFSNMRLLGTSAFYIMKNIVFPVDTNPSQLQQYLDPTSEMSDTESINRMVGQTFRRYGDIYHQSAIESQNMAQASVDANRQMRSIFYQLNFTDSYSTYMLIFDIILHA